MRASDLHISSLAQLRPEQWADALAQLSNEEADHLIHDWRFMARPEQVAPDGDWLVWTYLAGRGAGKTRSGAEWVREQVKGGCGRIGIVAPTAADARDVVVEGVSGLMAVCWQRDQTKTGAPMGRPLYEPSKRRLTWDNGAQAALFSAEEPDRLRGPQHDALYCDELAAWQNLQETWDMAMFGLRLGKKPQAMVTTTPRPIKLLKDLIRDPRNVKTRGTTWDNRANLAKQFFDQVVSKYEGTRLGRQELEGEILEETEGALWAVDMLERVRLLGEPPDMQRVVVGVDPSGCSGPEDKRSDEIGIIVAGVGADGVGYVLEDLSGAHAPEAWSRIVCSAYERWDAACVVAEVNFGGALVRAIIQAASKGLIGVREVRASRGKAVRAEPIALLFEQGKVRLAGRFRKLEDQLCAMTVAGYVGDKSPDRADAMVWALSSLFPSLTKDGAKSLLPKLPPLPAYHGNANQAWMMR